MKHLLLWKLLAVNLIIIAIVIVCFWLAVDWLAADYFSHLMEEYKISPSDTHQMFLDAIHRYIIQASVAASIIAAGLCYYLTRKILLPLSQMTLVTKKIASGDYSARVKADTQDEVGQLADSFNRMADSLENIESLRRRMVADFAHELRTPLTNMRGYLEAIADGVVEPSKETLEILQQEMMRLVRLADDLQQLSKADAARVYLSREIVDLNEMIDHVVTLNQHEFQSRDIVVETHVAPDVSSINADTDKLLQVLSNLVQNASQYTTPGGRFKLNANRCSDGVLLEFTNSNETLSDGDIPFLFERFYRGDKSRTRDKSGSGIGLSIVKQLVEAHGGRMEASKVGNELSFRLILPA